MRNLLLVFLCLVVSLYPSKASAILMSNGVVILMFSRLPSTIATWQPRLSTTEASSVNCSLYSWLKACFARPMSKVWGSLHHAVIVAQHVLSASVLVDIAQGVGYGIYRDGCIFFASRLETFLDYFLRYEWAHTIVNATTPSSSSGMRASPFLDDWKRVSPPLAIWC